MTRDDASAVSRGRQNRPMHIPAVPQPSVTRQAVNEATA